MNDFKHGISVISDLSRCEPHSALSRHNRVGCWTVVSYETEDGLAGEMLYAGDGMEAPPATLSLDCAGWYAVYLGLHEDVHGPISMVKARLTADASYSVFGDERCQPKDGSFAEKAYSPQDLHEVFWKHADLTGQAITFAHPGRRGIGAGPTCSAVAFVRLVPLTPDEVARVRRLQESRAEHRRLIACLDGGVGVLHPEMSSADDLRELIEPFRDSDFRGLVWTAARSDLCHYPSRLASMRRDRPWYALEASAWTVIGEALNRLLARGIDPLRAVIDIAREAGVELYPSMRMTCPKPPPHHELNQTPLYRDHPEWCARDERGRPTAHLSFAYPGVRERLVAILREMAGYGPDGICPQFTRGMPYVGYDPPVVAAFREQYGVDPFTLALDDPRWMQHRAGYVTQFLRECRAALDEVGAHIGRRIALIPYALNNVRNSLFFNLDVVTWAREGLADALLLHLTHNAAAAGPGGANTGPDAIRDVKAAFAGTGVPIYPDVYPRRMPARAYRELAIENYAAGADGMVFWDTDLRTQRASEWAMLRNLGHRDELADWPEDLAAYFTTHRLATHAGVPVGGVFGSSDG